MQKSIEILFCLYFNVLQASVISC